MRHAVLLAAILAALCPSAIAGETYVNFEVSHVHPIDLTPAEDLLLVVNTPDAVLEVFPVLADGSLGLPEAIPVGLEPVTVVARSDGEAWVVNHLSDTVSVVDLTTRAITRTLAVGDEPTDVAFAGGKAFVAISQEDAVKVYNLANLDAPPAVVPLFGRDVRALAVSNDGDTVYAVVLHSGNRTTVINRNVVFGNDAGLDDEMLAALGMSGMDCNGPPPPYPPLPAGISRDPSLPTPAGGTPQISLIVRWDDGQQAWLDDAGQDWTHCVGFRMPDHDLFAIDVASLDVTETSHLGTTLFDVSVQPETGRIYVPNTEARNFVRFEHALGLQGHVVDNRLSIVDPANGGGVTIMDLNAHVVRGPGVRSDAATRAQSIAQPGMLVWASDGQRGFLTGLGSDSVFEVNGSCLAPGCIFGPDRAQARKADVGSVPSGLALAEGVGRLYVLNRASHSVSIVATDSLERLDDVPLHDPSFFTTRVGRRFLYEATDRSAHGDASCASCHVSGDRDFLAWDLGNPEGSFVPYSKSRDNVRFIAPNPNGAPMDCEAALAPEGCSSQAGFDPEKGPMTTQTFRGMTEPLHWRGDRPTLNDFNGAFVGLLGAENAHGTDSSTRGLTKREMRIFRQFALEIRTAPNPHRNPDDTLPCAGSADPACEVQVAGMLLPGNPAAGQNLFENAILASPVRCVSCHESAFGTAGGRLMGVAPKEPTSPLASALVNGERVGAPHNDLVVPHTRNVYEKTGPAFDMDAPVPPDAMNGFGVEHDGSTPDLYRFLSEVEFSFSPDNQAEQLRDVVAFLFHFPTETRPAVGRQVTLPPGAPPTGTPAEEDLLDTLVSLGDAADGARHCDLVVSARSGPRTRRYRLSGGLWLTDVAGEAAVTTTALREGAGSALTFHCVTVGSGERLGGNRDEDARLDGDDCATADPSSWGMPAAVDGLRIVPHGNGGRMRWPDQRYDAGPAVRYDVLSGPLGAIAGDGLASTVCEAADVTRPTHDVMDLPAPGDGTYYLIRAENACGQSPVGATRGAAQAAACTDGP